MTVVIESPSRRGLLRPRCWVSWAFAFAAFAAEAAAQQVLVVDMDAGRELVGRPEYVFGPAAVVDYGRRLVLTTEIADPLAVTAYSLDDGSVQGVFGGGPAGDGPGELTQVSALAVGPNGVFVGGAGRVLHWSWSGTLIHQWRPKTPNPRNLCAWHGRPTVTLQEGVLFRDDDGESVAVGGEAKAHIDQTSSSLDEVVWTLSTTMMACADSAAYVLVGYRHVLTEYKIGAEPRVLPIPAELMEVAQERIGSALERREPSSASGNSVPLFMSTNVYGDMFLADDGRLVITIPGRGVTGAVVDQATGCYALLEGSRSLPGGKHYIGMFADSIVISESSRQPISKETNGQRYNVWSSDRTHIFVRPIRPVSGEPCSQ